MRKLLGLWTVLVLAALYTPSLVTALFSFNASRHLTWTGFTLEWYRRLFGNRELAGALMNSLALASTATAAGLLMGTLAALALRRPFPGGRGFAALVKLPMTLPDVVLGISSLALFRAAGVDLSLATAVAAHTTFTTAYVATVAGARLARLDPHLEPAAQDLGASPLQAFIATTWPALRPALVSGALLAFAMSFDDFAVAYFSNGPGRPTLPVLIYSMLRFGVTPEIHALSTLLTAASAVFVIGSYAFVKAGERR